MSTEAEKIAMAKHRVKVAVDKILHKDPDFTGQFNLEIHCKNGIVFDIYEIKSRRKVS